MIRRDWWGGRTTGTADPHHFMSTSAPKMTVSEDMLVMHADPFVTAEDERRFQRKVQAMADGATFWITVGDVKELAKRYLAIAGDRYV